MSKLLLPIDKHYIGRITWRGQSTLNTIREKFDELKILDKVRAYPFKYFFQAPSLRFSGVIMHQLLLRKIKSESKNEIHFEISGRSIKL